MHAFSISSSSICINSIRSQCLDSQSGAFCSFEGWVRNHHCGKSVNSLEYSCYEALAIKEGEQILCEAKEKFAIASAFCTHRVGHLAIGEMAVYVAVGAAHRDAAFLACRYIIDEIKSRVPIWKKEHYSDGSVAWPHTTSRSQPSTDSLE
jgi:molybdopterin synthase catalytic subunit